MAGEFKMPELPEILAFDVDSFVDDALTKTTLLDEVNYRSSYVQVQESDKSPFHESDSGISEASNGKSPSWQMDVMLDEMLDNMQTTPFLSSSGADDQDKELVSYLRSGAEQTDFLSDIFDTSSLQQIGSQPVSLDFESDSCSNASDRLVGMNTRSQKYKVSSSDNPTIKSQSAKVRQNVSKRKCNRDSSSDDSDIYMDSDNTVFRSMPKGSIKVKQVGAKLPSTTNSTSGNCSVTSVKVLRIVKSGNENNTENVVERALEERNRKNAEMARQNRLKKKAYVGNLEQEVEDGKKRIDELESALSEAEEERASYKKEVEYLKSVLANQSALAGLLKNIPNVKGVSLSSSVTRKRVAELDHDYTPMKKSRQLPGSSSQSAGVCLHVDNDNVSLEFCHHCAEMAHGVS